LDQHDVRRFQRRYGNGYAAIDFVGKYRSQYLERLKFVMSVDPFDSDPVAKLEEFRSKYNSRWIKLILSISFSSQIGIELKRAEKI
jgi:hypothetical protein